MTICLGKSRSFGLLYVSFVNVYQILCVSFFPFCYSGWDVRCDCVILIIAFLFTLQQIYWFFILFFIYLYNILRG